jgi:hypothetical protein
MDTARGSHRSKASRESGCIETEENYSIGKGPPATTKRGSTVSAAKPVRATPKKLMDKARAAPLSQLRSRRVIDVDAPFAEQLELAIAWYKGDISGPQAASALEMPRTNIDRWAQATIRHGLRDGQVDLVLKDRS